MINLFCVWNHSSRLILGRGCLLSKLYCDCNLSSTECYEPPEIYGEQADFEFSYFFWIFVGLPFFETSEGPDFSRGYLAFIQIFNINFWFDHIFNLSAYSLDLVYLSLQPKNFQFNFEFHIYIVISVSLLKYLSACLT